MDLEKQLCMAYISTLQKNLFLFASSTLCTKTCFFFFLFFAISTLQKPCFCYCDGLVMGRTLGISITPVGTHITPHLIPPPLHLENSQQNSSFVMQMATVYQRPSKEQVQKQRTKHTEQSSWMAEYKLISHSCRLCYNSVDIQHNKEPEVIKCIVYIFFQKVSKLIQSSRNAADAGSIAFIWCLTTYYFSYLTACCLTTSSSLMTTVGVMEVSRRNRKLVAASLSLSIAKIWLLTTRW